MRCCLQVNLHVATGQYSLQPVGMHCDVRQVPQVLCLPQALQPAAPAAVVRAAKLADAMSMLLSAPGDGSQQHSDKGLRSQQQPQRAAGVAAADGAGAVGGMGMRQQEVERGGGSQPAVTAAAASADAAGVEQLQQMLEAGLHALCLDEDGAVVEFGWARQRTVPARWMRTTACMPLGGTAAVGSLHVVPGSAGGGAAAAQQQQGEGKRLVQLLPGDPAERDGLPLHWLGFSHPDRAAAVIAAAANGSVTCLQRLPAAEGQLLLALQQVLLQHPLTSGMVLGGQQLLKQEQAQQQVRQKTASPAATAAAPTGARGSIVDAKVLSVFLCLPHRVQLLLLDSALWPAAGADSVHACLLQDGLRCRLQTLMQ
jgi:hypothetical protein